MITEIRKSVLKPFISYLQSNIDLKEVINLNFICTHNSRRSHLAQVWGQLAAYKYGFHQIRCYSGGTEATAVYPMIIETLKQQNLNVITLSEGSNPIYSIKADDAQFPIVSFSKKYDHPFNPKSNFTAVMTCSEADENCPNISGAKFRIALNYEDPKIYDGTEKAASMYLEKSEKIKEEMFYVFSKL